MSGDGSADSVASATKRFQLSRPAHLIALGFGSGLVGRAPGTVGTLWAWCVFVVLEDWLSPAMWAVLIVFAFLLGIWACGRAAADVGVADHSSIVWDEVVAFWLVLWVLPADWLTQACAFGLFRVFDIVKPPPIGYFDRTLKGGWGVMFDDLLAALLTLFVFALWHTAIGGVR